ncbi:MAG: sigma-70 family RNA polymerase sigma factor [Saprospiraceae bacterium]
MSRILEVFFGRESSKVNNKYSDNATLYNGLKNEDGFAIRFLYSKCSATIYKLGKQYNLTDEDIEELICDCITLLLLKIREGSYIFQQNNPASYVIEVAKNKVRNYSLKESKNQSFDLDAVAEPFFEMDYMGSENEDLINKLLLKLDSNCQKLIRLKYLYEYKDTEIINTGLTQYSTVDALKNHRSKCMRKLVELTQNKSLNNIRNEQSRG